MRYLFTLFLLSTSLLSIAQQFVPRAGMPFKRFAMGTAAVNGKIYVIGGSCIDSLVKRVDEYDPATNAWTTRQPMIKAVTEAVVAAVGGKIYVIGGYSTGGAANDVQEYNPATNTWTSKLGMPTSRSVISGAVINNKIYVTCGWSGSYQQLEIFRPIYARMQQWRILAAPEIDKAVS